MNTSAASTSGNDSANESSSSGSELHQKSKDDIWHLKEDVYGIYIYIRGVRAQYRPGHSKKGKYGAVIDAKVDDAAARKVKIFFMEKSMTIRKLDDFRDSLGLSRSMKISEFVLALNKLISTGIEEEEATLNAVTPNEHVGETTAVAPTTTQKRAHSKDTEEASGSNEEVETPSSAKKKKAHSKDIEEASGSNEEVETPSSANKKKAHSKDIEEASGSNEEVETPSSANKKKAHSKDTEEASGSNGDNVTPTGAKKKKAGKSKVKPIPRVIFKKETDEFDESIRRKFVGDFKVPVEHLLKPPPQFQLRAVNDSFVKTIVESYNPNQGFGFGFTRLPVAVVDDLLFVAGEAQRSKYFTLGGNHLREAASILQKAGKLHLDHQTIWVSVYRGLTSDEGLRLGANHNMVTHHTRKSTFMDRAVLARKLLFSTFGLSEGDEPPAKDNLTRDGRRQKWKTAFGRAMNETNVGKNKLEKFATVFHTAGLSIACWDAVVNLTVEKPTLGAGTFKNLHGLIDEDILKLLDRLQVGELPTYAMLRDEARRLKSLRHLKKALPKLLHKGTWEKTVQEFPCLTDEVLHSYLALDWSKGTPKTVATLCSNLHQQRGTILQRFEYQGSKVHVTNVVPEDVNEDIVNFMTEDDTITPEDLGKALVITNFTRVSDILQKLEETHISWKIICLSYGNTLIPLIVTGQIVSSNTEQVFAGTTDEEVLVKLIKAYTKPEQWIRCDDKDIALAALRSGRNVICKDESGEVKDHVVMLIETMNDTDEEQLSDMEDGTQMPVSMEDGQQYQFDSYDRNDMT